MPRRSRTDVSKIRESLQTVCTECGHSIAPIDLVRLDNERVRCPACGKEFVPTPKARCAFSKTDERGAGTGDGVALLVNAVGGVWKRRGKNGPTATPELTGITV